MMDFVGSTNIKGFDITDTTDINSIYNNNTYTNRNDNHGYATESDENNNNHSEYDIHPQKPQSH